MSLLDKKAAAICAKLEANPEFRAKFGEDPPAPGPSPHPFLDFIKELLTQFMPMILGCFATPAGIHKALQSPRPGLKVLGRMHVRRAMRASDQDEWSVKAINDAMFSVAQDTTVDEFKQLVN